MRRPLLPLTVAYVSGVVAGHLAKPPSGTMLVLGLVTLAAAVVARVPANTARSAVAGGRVRLFALCCLALAVLAGALGSSLAWEKLGPGEAVSGGPPRWVETEGTVISEPRPTALGHSFLMRASAGGSYWRRGEVFYVWCREASRTEPGLLVRVQGFLGRPRPPGNPGEFNFPLYLAVRGVRYTLSAKTMSPLDQDVGGVRGLVRWFESACRSVRDALIAKVVVALPPDQSALFAGLVFGDTSRLPDDVARDFRRSGLFHILAVSGSNVAFVAGGFWMAARLVLLTVGRRGRGADLIILPATALVLPGYAVMVGMDPSVTRATLMAMAGLVYLWLGRRRDISGPLCLAAVSMLAWRPLAILDPGFQLSYAATLGILTIYPPLWRAVSGRLDRLQGPRFLGKMVTITVQVALVSLAAQAAVTPILAVHFGEVSIVGLVANALVVPCSGVAIATGLAAALVDLGGGLLRFPAGLLYLLTSLLLWVTIGSARLFSAVPFASVVTGAPAVFLVIGYYLALAWVVRGARGGRGCLRLLRVLVLTMTLTVAWLGAGVVAPAHAVEVTFLDVGQGDATHIRLPGGASFLIDGGPMGAGRRVVGPYLRHRGVSRLDVVFVSHLHDDHLGGLVEVLSDPAFRIGELVVAAGILTGELTPLAAALLQAAAIRGVPVREVSAGTLLRCVGGSVYLAVLAPPAPSDEDGATTAAAHSLGATRSSRENNASLVLKLVFGSAAVLLPGDIEREGEEALLKTAVPLQSTVLKVAHHGSAYGTGHAFLREAAPAVAVISVGANSFGHPSPGTEARLDACGAVRLSTQDDGAVTFRFASASFTTQTFRTRLRLILELEQGRGEEPGRQGPP